MAKKIIRLTEQDLQKIVVKVIKEQSEERNFVRAIQRFLNEKLKLNPKLEVDGRTGPNSKTAAAIEKYQRLIGVPEDGEWGEQTMNKMPLTDKKRFKKLMAEEGDLIDKFVHLIGL